tara:strand:+ start:1598 stop:1870 length:273 start_codon:yes stop_codon:yes gene_type:complete
MGKVGRMQYSIEAGERSIDAMMLIRSTAKRRPTRFAVTRNVEVALSGDIRLAAPVMPKMLITAVSILLANVKLYLDIFSYFINIACGPKY